MLTSLPESCIVTGKRFEVRPSDKKNQNPSPSLGKLVFPYLCRLLELSFLFCKNVFPVSVIWAL